MNVSYIKGEEIFDWLKCEYFWWSVPELLLDENRDGDIVQGGDDHSYDETRYGLMGILIWNFSLLLIF